MVGILRFEQLQLSIGHLMHLGTLRSARGQLQHLRAGSGLGLEEVFVFDSKNENIRVRVMVRVRVRVRASTSTYGWDQGYDRAISFWPEG